MRSRTPASYRVRTGNPALPAVLATRLLAGSKKQVGGASILIYRANQPRFFTRAGGDRLQRNPQRSTQRLGNVRVHGEQGDSDPGRSWGKLDRLLVERSDLHPSRSATGMPMHQ